MQLGSINLVVKDADRALQDWLRMIGTNNVGSVIKVTGLNDASEIVDGYYLKTQPIMLGIFSPRSPGGRMAAHLAEHGEGMHHLEFHLGQDDFLALHESLKASGAPVSEKPVFLGKLSEAVFWLEEDGEQGVPVKFSTKAYHGFGKDGAIYLDSPQRIEQITPEESHERPEILLVTAVIATKAAEQFDKQHHIWSTILSQPAPVRTMDASTQSLSLVNDGRGDLFWPSSYLLQGHAKISIYHAVGDGGPIQAVLSKRQRNAMYHNIIFLVTRDRIHDHWQQLEDGGFNMVDPKPLLLGSTANYFFFVHPSSTHGVPAEFVSRTKLDKKTGEFQFDWTNTRLSIVAPDINDRPAAATPQHP